MTVVILLAIKVVVGLRVDEKSERMGLDISQHGEMIAPN
jgi:ammonia channel protein AmtB